MGTRHLRAFGIFFVIVAIAAPAGLASGQTARPPGDKSNPVDLALHPSLAGPAVGDAAQANAVDLEKSRAFVSAMCTDTAGNVWVGTEGDGVQKYDPSKPPLQAWIRYTDKDGLGDDYGYSIACDTIGRIWVGSLNHGVSVYDGTRWQTYEPVAALSRPHTLAGPLGERVFHITVNPKDGDVWMATNCGLCRYSQSHDTWTYYTRAEGLPSDLASSIAFDADENIYVAMQLDGIEMADAKDDYKTWRQVTGPQEEPTAASGAGLPSNYINDIVFADDGTLYAATDTGLAWSADRGKTWQFLRGKDYAAKVRASYDGPPAGWVPTSNWTLAEDYCTCLAAEPGGKVVVGHRTSPPDEIGVKSPGRAVSTVSMFSHAFVMTPRPLQGTYSDGVFQLSSINLPAAPPPAAPPPAAPQAAAPPMPAGAPVPNLADLNRELAAIASVKPADSKTSPVIALDDDWRTQGDWLGRYGRYWADLYGMGSLSGEYLWGAAPTPVTNKLHNGDAVGAPDSPHYWIGELATADRRTLEMPPVFASTNIQSGSATPNTARRQAEMNDDGQTDPQEAPGPGLLLDLDVPDGTFVLSMYFINDDAHIGMGHNRQRDFPVTITTNTPGGPAALATTRVIDFWAGTYKRFLVHGPINLTAMMFRNHSINVIISGVMLDQPDPRPAPYFQTFDEFNKARAAQLDLVSKAVADWKTNPAGRAPAFAPRATELEAAESLGAALDQMRDWNPSWWAQNQRRISLLLSRWSLPSATLTTPHDRQLEESWLYQAGLFDNLEKLQLSTVGKSARQLEHSLQSAQPGPTGSGQEYQIFLQQILHQTPPPGQNPLIIQQDPFTIP